MSKTDTTLASIRTTPGTTQDGKPFDHSVRRKVDAGKWRLELIPAEVTGTARPIEVYRATRKTTLIKPWKPDTDDESYCPAHWADIAIGRGACGFRCRACFLMLTHRAFCDPSRHVLYENVEDYEKAVRKELKRSGVNLGLGIDCSDSLLYEGVTGHARRLIPLFSDAKTNPHDRKLILLTKSTNVHHLEGLPTRNVVVTFSLNPEPIADLWEGKWEDGARITPPIEKRLEASALSDGMGFEVRWRVDPILPVDGWERTYQEFFERAAGGGHAPTRITLGSYREMNPMLSTFAKKWGLPPMEWTPGGLVKDEMHWHLPEEERVAIYCKLKDLIENAWKDHGGIPIVALCKGSRAVRDQTGIRHEDCNCG